MIFVENTEEGSDEFVNSGGEKVLTRKIKAFKMD